MPTLIIVGMVLVVHMCMHLGKTRTTIKQRETNLNKKDIAEVSFCFVLRASHYLAQAGPKLIILPP